MIILYRPKLEDLWFRERFMADPDTMSYNRAWGGTIPFPRSCWEEWYDRWVVRTEQKRFYRYLQERDSGSFAGEIAYHYDERQDMWLADVIVAAEYRGRGYGREGLDLLCCAARENGIGVLWDNIALDNPAAGLFLRAGFSEEYRTDEFIMLKKTL